MSFLAVVQSERVISMDLDKLQSECERLVLLLKDRQQGMFTWNMAVAERLQAIKKFANDAGIPD